MKTEEAVPVLCSSKDLPDGKHTDQGREQLPIAVYKIVSVIDGHRESLAMQACSAIYSQDKVTYPPIPNSPLFAYRTLEAAQREFDRFIELNAWRTAHLAAPPMEIWLAQTTGEMPVPNRVPSVGHTIYPGLLRKCGYGATLADCYTFFWQNTTYCLKHLIGKRAGQKLDASITICCQDLILLKQIRSEKHCSSREILISPERNETL